MTAAFKPSFWLRNGLPVLAAFFIGGLATAWVGDSHQPLGGFGNEDGKLGGKFTLNSAQGPVSLTDFHGQVVVLYFGFLGCNNYCDTSMSVLSTTFERLPETDREQVQALMVSIDPWRDDIAALDEYTKSWHPQILGLAGSPDTISAVTQRYGAFYERTESKDGGDYEYLHTSRFFIVNRDGELVDAMRHSTTPNELAARLQQHTGAPRDNG